MLAGALVALIEKRHERGRGCGREEDALGGWDRHRTWRIEALARARGADALSLIVLAWQILRARAADAPEAAPHLSLVANQPRCAVLDTKRRCYICNAMGRRLDDRNEAMRRFVLRHIKAGSLSVTGAAFVADVSKMTISRWCARAGIDPAAAEHSRWLELRSRAERLVDGHGVRDQDDQGVHPRVGPSRSQRQREADWANREWSKRLADPEEASTRADTQE